MSKTFRLWKPEQTLLLHPSPVDWLPQNHLMFFLLDLAAELDLGEIDAYYRRKDPRGGKGVRPADVDEVFREAVGGAAPVRLLRWVAQFSQDRVLASSLMC